MADRNDIPDYHRASTPVTTALPEQDGKLNILLVTRGHPFDRDTFFDVFDSNPEIQYSNVEHPAAQFMFNPEMAKRFDCYVQYDMPGVQFGDAGPEYPEPPEFYKEGVRAMGEAGCPLVIMHHAAAAWPAWPEWAEIVGGHFLYTPMKSRGVHKPDSGYNIDVSHRVSPVLDHPITAGIKPFKIVMRFIFRKCLKILSFLYLPQTGNSHAIIFTRPPMRLFVVNSILMTIGIMITDQILLAGSRPIRMRRWFIYNLVTALVRMKILIFGAFSLKQ